MEVSYNDLKNKEVINVVDGRKLGHIVDIVFDNLNGHISGVVVPGDKKLFRKCEDVFVPLAKIKKIGNDVILVILNGMKNSGYYPSAGYNNSLKKEQMYENAISVYYDKENNDNKTSYVRYKRIDRKKYK